MAHMQDKEFDLLFKQQFEAFEVEPSANVKSDIFQKLNDKKEDKGSYQSLWAVAATIAVIISAGTWFSIPGEKVRLYGKTQDEEPIVEDPRAGTPQTSSEHYAAAEEIEDTPSRKPERRISTYRKAIEKSTFENEYPEATAYRESESAEIAFAEQKNLKIVQEKALTGTTDTASYVWPMDDNDWEKENEALASAAKSRNTVGDLINFVISKVDKRKNKIIEFTDTDEGSMVSGINLGFVRFKHNGYHN